VTPLTRPILTDELQALPYAERRKFVIEAINNIGPSNEEETPNPPNAAFAKEVKNWIAQTGSTEVRAVFFKALESLTHITSEETRALIQAGRGERKDFGNDAMRRWFLEMAGWLFEWKNLT
jgi:hypothetical protein